MADIIGKRSGFNYSQRWGSQPGQTGAFSLGSRPVPEGDWNEMTDEEKLATMGTTDGHFLDQAHDEYQKRSQPGGDIYNERARAYEAISNSGAQDWQGIERALLGAGFDPSVQESGPLFKELSQIFKGNPLVNLAAQQPQNQSATFAPGMAGIRQYLPGGKEEELMRSWHGGGNNELQPLPNGGYTDGAGNFFDRFGYGINPATGARNGKHYLNFSGLTQNAAYTGYTPPGTQPPPPNNAPPGTPPKTPPPGNYNPNMPYSPTNIPPDFIPPKPGPNSNPGNPNVSTNPPRPPIPKDTRLNAYGVSESPKASAWGVSPQVVSSIRPSPPPPRPQPLPPPDTSMQPNDIYKGTPPAPQPFPAKFPDRKPGLNPRPKPSIYG